jgi:GDP-D-mannose 3',5'-epimerase
MAVDRKPQGLQAVEQVKRAIVCGGAGFLGAHLVKRLKAEGYHVRAVDQKRPEFEPSAADKFMLVDLRQPRGVEYAFAGQKFDECYQLAADMGGMGWISGEHDAEILSNSARINLNIVDACYRTGVGKVFFSSSACVYPDWNVEEIGYVGGLLETDAYPAAPDSDYGWEKLLAERLYQAYARNYGLQVRIARLHNVFGPLGAWRGGREKAPAAICRKVAEVEPGLEIEVWGDGTQTRSFMYVDDCIEGIIRLIRSDFQGPVNLGSEEMVTIDQLVGMVATIGNKMVQIKHIPGPVGVQGRNSDNTLLRKHLNWAPVTPLAVGLAKTYPWVLEQVWNAQAKARQPTEVE